ncbi:uncharacterized protein LOC143282515 isoform X2 [Babylonia areolata]|uniref:uncharacterized protein LOC143282515 isoform X2 n=1 Tax=Babylonia areolata TaxID=304850 RepID=UPI003FD5BC8A
MDDYIEPRDSKKFLWGDLKSPLSTNNYSDDEEDEDGYSQPYNWKPGGVLARKQPSPTQAETSEDPYEISPDHPTNSATAPDYDVPPPPRKVATDSHPDDYSHLKHNGALPAKTVPRNSTSSDERQSDAEDYSHADSWTNKHQQSGNTAHSSTPTTPTTTTRPTSRQNSNGSQSGMHHPVFTNTPSRPHSQEGAGGARSFARQKVIYSRRSNSSTSGMPTEVEGGGGGRSPQHSPGPAIYEMAWDTAEQQRRLEENLRLARSISTCSDTFEDALEYLPEDWAPTRLRNSSAHANRRSNTSLAAAEKTIDPVTGGEYEAAWDLNRGLEEKLRSLAVARPASESGSGGGEEEGNYLEPWDLKQRELEKKLQMASAEAGAHRKSAGSSQLPPSPSHHHHHQHQQQQGSGGGADLYETPWDTKKGLAQLLQSSHSVEGHRGSPGSGGSPVSTRSNQSVSCAVGEPINAMIPLNNQEWYHGNISRSDAERMLVVCKDGSYLVRDSSDRCHYTLSIKSPTQPIHIQIDQCRKSDGSMRYILGRNSKAFPTIPSMIDHYTHHVVPIKGAEHMTLLYPVHCKYSGGEESSA